MRSALAVIALSLALTIDVQHDDHGGHGSDSPPAQGHIVVTINPEARVSAVLGKPLPPAPLCGSGMDLDVQVLNNGFVTAPLRAEALGDERLKVALQIDKDKLSGEPEDLRTLHLLPMRPDPVDVTIAFSIDDTIGDLVGRDRVHLLLRCTQASEPTAILRFGRPAGEGRLIPGAKMPG